MNDLMEHLQVIKTGNGKIAPGQEVRISRGVAPGDGGWQGDLKILIVDRLPADYIRIKSPKEIDKQLVPGNTQGSRHCLESLDTVELYHPPGFSHDMSYEDFAGPGIVCLSETRILHATHGAVIAFAGLSILFRYQRNLDVETKRERRALD